MKKTEIKNLTFSYPDSKSPVIRDLSFSVERGEFLTIIGSSGSGKSTLLSLLKPELAPRGDKSGSIQFDGRDADLLSARESAEKIGYLFQDPDKQLVTDKVWHELAFGMESLGCSSHTIRLRTAEVASYLGITELFERDTHTLSGGQKQLVNLASLLCMNPDLLLLDEPTAQLDPIASEEFMELLSRLHRDTGITIILAEHRLEAVAQHTDKLLILRKNSPAAFGPIKKCISLLPKDDPILSAFPASVRLYKAVEAATVSDINMESKVQAASDIPMESKVQAASDIPMTISEGRRFISEHIGTGIFSRDIPIPTLPANREVAISIKELSFSYERHGKKVLKDLDLQIYRGEILTLLGGNGQGKSTLMQIIAGLLKADRGKVSILGKDISKHTTSSLYSHITMLPQQVESLFLCDSVREELRKIPTPVFPMTELLDTHPYDLSGGEKALLGLNLVMSRDVKILLLDEPTKGLDTENKQIVADALRRLRDKGITIFLISHDIELAALLSDRIALLFDGQIAAIDEPHSFFKNNYFYTTHFARMTRGLYDDVILEKECVDIALANLKCKSET